MPRDLFGDVTSPRVSVGSRKWYTVPLSLAAHVAIIVPLVLVPLLAADVLPDVHDYMVLTPHEVLPPDPPPPAARVREERPRANPDAAPIDVPDRIAPEPATLFDAPEPMDFGIPGGIPGNSIVTGEPPPPPPEPATRPPAPVRPGGDVRPPVKVREVAPVYPAIAQAARVQGTVILQATISTTGEVEDVKVLRSIPLLDQAAIEAVRQWKYSATLLNGVPVSVIVTVTVTFTLNR